MRGEHTWPVRPLDPTMEGVELFTERAGAADPSYALGDDDEAVARLCSRLDGIPLAIELAAARIRSMTPADLLTRLDDRFRLLRGGRDAEARHATLRATVEWSYQLLGEPERNLFDQLSVFAGTFDLPAVEQVVHRRRRRSNRCPGGADGAGRQVSRRGERPVRSATSQASPGAGPAGQRPVDSVNQRVAPPAVCDEVAHRLRLQPGRGRRSG